MSWYTYILPCDQKSYYIGITNNLGQRTNSHKSGYNLTTKRYSEIKLVFSEQNITRKSAENRERQIKRWSRAKKKALVEGKTDLLIKLSKSRAF